MTFTVAVKRKQGRPSNVNSKGEPSDVDYIECIAWNNIAKNLRLYGVKGGLVLIHGELQTYVTKLGSGAYVKRYYVYVREIDLVNWRKPEEEVRLDDIEAEAQPSSFELDIADSMMGYTKAHTRRRPMPNIDITESKLAGFDGDPDMPDIYSTEEYGIEMDDDDLDRFEDDDLEEGGEED